jgi:hypothetical protein
VDREYFESYCGRGPYHRIYLDHSGVTNCLATLRRMRIRVRSLLVLGAATGEVLGDFERALRVRAFGCEVSRWAHARIPAHFRRRIRRADLRRYVPELARAGRHFDVLFTSALVYLAAGEIEPVLRDCAALAPFFHFYSSTSEDFEPGDRRRALLRPRAWWRARFEAAGFEPTRSRYLWRRRGDWDARV